MGLHSKQWNTDDYRRDCCVECLWKIEEEKMKEIKKKKERLCLERKEKGKWRKEREKEM